MDDLNEVITSASFHPSQCNVMMYSSSRGVVRVADLRQAALCTSHAQSEWLDELGVDGRGGRAGPALIN